MKKLMIAILMVTEVCYSRPVKNSVSLKKQMAEFMKEPLPEGIELTLTRNSLTVSGAHPDGNCVQVVTFDEKFMTKTYREYGTSKSCEVTP